MGFWSRKKSKEQTADQAATEVLYLNEKGDSSAEALPEATPHQAEAVPTQSREQEAVVVASEPPVKAGLFSRQIKTEVRTVEIPSVKEVSSTKATLFDGPHSIQEELDSSLASQAAPAPVESPPSKAPRDKKEKSKKAKAQRPEKPAEVDAWRKGAKGRPSHVFIGFLANSNKKDATKYAIGVANQNAVNPVNAGFAVYPWQDGWAYEVHEGGPMRAYLPTILRFFDAQGDASNSADLVITIKTAGRSVRVERAHAGVTAFMMPESFDGKQTEWLEPGQRLKPAVPVRMGVLAAGAAIFATGFLAMLVTFVRRPDPPHIQSNKRMETRFEQLPISQWQTLVSAASNGYVDALEYLNGQWKISRARTPAADPVNTPPPPVPAPNPSEGK